MDYGILTEPQIGGSYQAQLRLARWCADNDVAVFARSDHYRWGDGARHATDAFTALAGLARETSGVRLCVLVSPITFRHPAVIAKSAATLDEMSGGRFNLGVGTGWMQEEHDAFGLDLWPMKERFARLEEALRYLRAAFAPDSPGFTGEYYTLQDVDPHPKPRHLPIVVGGGGARKTPTLAGRYADEYNQFVDTLANLRDRFDVFRAAAADAGRNPADIVVSVVTQIYAGHDQADYRSRLEAAAARRNVTAEEFEQRLTGRGMPHGTKEQVQEAVAALGELGVERLYVQVIDSLDDIENTELERLFDLVRG